MLDVHMPDEQMLDEQMLAVPDHHYSIDDELCTPILKVILCKIDRGQCPIGTVGMGYPRFSDVEIEILYEIR